MEFTGFTAGQGVWAVAVVLYGLVPVAGAAAYSGGAGTEPEPYQIVSVADWKLLCETTADWDKHFVLTGDIDFAGAPLTPIGTLSMPFVGEFDGNGHAVGKGQINATESYSVGVFGYVSTGGAIRNLGVVAVSVTGGGFVGGLAGRVFEGHS